LSPVAGSSSPHEIIKKIKPAISVLFIFTLANKKFKIE